MKKELAGQSIGIPGVSLVLESSVLQGGSGRYSRPLHWGDKPRCGPLCTLASSCSPGNLVITNIICMLIYLESQKQVKRTEKDLVVDSSSEVSWFEEVDGVEVGDVDPPGVGLGALRAVLLHVHPKETHVHPVLLLEGEHGAGAVWEVVQHVASVHIPDKMIMSSSMHQYIFFLLLQEFMTEISV